MQLVIGQYKMHCFEMFAFAKYRDLETSHSRSLEVTVFDRLYIASY